MGVEHYLEEDLLPRYRTLTPRGLIGGWMDAIDHRVGGLEMVMVLDDRNRELQGSVRAAAVLKRVIRRRVVPGGHIQRIAHWEWGQAAGRVRVFREHTVDLHDHVAYLPVPAMEQQPGKGGTVDDRGRRQDKVIGCLDLNLVTAFGTGGGGHLAIRVTSGEEKTVCRGRGSQHQHQRQGRQEAGYPSHNHSPVGGLGIAEELFTQDCIAAGPPGGPAPKA